MHGRIFLWLAGCWILGSAAVARAQNIPPELLEDPHFREEFGINEVTTPSIRKIFDQLHDLGEVPLEKYGREISGDQPTERPRLALSLGGLIAEGFFITQNENLEKLEEVGRAIVKRASALGTGSKLNAHSKALMEFSQSGDWDGLRDELGKTQRAVQLELIRLRDVEAVHLISLAGWLRAVEVICSVATEPYSVEKAEMLRRVDVVSYFAEELETLHPDTQQEDYISGLRRGLEELRGLVEIPPGEPVSEERLREIRSVVDEMAQWAFAE